MANSRTSASDLLFTKPVVLMTAAAVAAFMVTWAGSGIKPAGAAEVDVGIETGYERIAEDQRDSSGKKKKKKKKNRTRRGSFY